MSQVDLHEEVPLTIEHVEALVRSRFGRRREEVCGQLGQVARVLDGVASPPEIIAAGNHLHSCIYCREALGALSAAERPAGDGEVVRPHLVRSWHAPRWAMAVAAVVVLVTGIGVVLRQSDPQTRGGPFALKGATDALALAVERDGRRFVAMPGDPLQEGDRLGFFYSAASPGYLAVFVVGEAPSAKALFPTHADRSAAIEPGVQVPLPDGGIMHPAPGCEWLVAVFSDAPLDLAALRTAMLGAARRDTENCRLDLAFERARTVLVVPLG